MNAESAEPGKSDALSADDARTLAEYLKGRDVDCPRCGYNLRNLTSSACPECETPIELRIGEREINLVWFALAIVPSAFWGVLAAILLFLSILMGEAIHGAGLFFIVGLLSTAFAAGLIGRGGEFLERPWGRQAAWAAVLWIVHIVLFIVSMALLWI